MWIKRFAFPLTAQSAYAVERFDLSTSSRGHCWFVLKQCFQFVCPLVKRIIDQIPIGFDSLMQQNCKKNICTLKACIFSFPVGIVSELCPSVLKDYQLYNSCITRQSVQYEVKYCSESLYKNILYSEDKVMLLHFAQIEFWKACPSAATQNTGTLRCNSTLLCEILLLNNFSEDCMLYYISRAHKENHSGTGLFPLSLYCVKSDFRTHYVFVCV